MLTLRYWPNKISMYAKRICHWLRPFRHKPNAAALANILLTRHDRIYVNPKLTNIIIPKKQIKKYTHKFTVKDEIWWVFKVQKVVAAILQKNCNYRKKQRIFPRIKSAVDDAALNCILCTTSSSVRRLWQKNLIHSIFSQLSTVVFNKLNSLAR